MEVGKNKVEELLESHTFEIHIDQGLQDRIAYIELTDFLKETMARRIVEVLPRACLELDMNKPIVRLVVFTSAPSHLDYEGQPCTDFDGVFFFYTDQGVKRLNFNFGILSGNIRMVQEVNKEVDAELKVAEVAKKEAEPVGEAVQKSSWTIKDFLKKIGIIS